MIAKKIELKKVTQLPGSDWVLKPRGLSSLWISQEEEAQFLSGEAIAWLNPQPSWGEECFVYFNGEWHHMFSTAEVNDFVERARTNVGNC